MPRKRNSTTILKSYIIIYYRIYNLNTSITYSKIIKLKKWKGELKKKFEEKKPVLVIYLSFFSFITF